MKHLLLSVAILLPSPAAADCVVLLHGLARTEASLLVMAEALVAHDYRDRQSRLSLDQCPDRGACRGPAGSHRAE
jgi:hypothetical protein